MSCPSCGFEYTYEDNGLMVCSACQFQWDLNDAKVEDEEINYVIDSNGNKLYDGDNVTIIKDLKVKGAPSDLKLGTKVTNIKVRPGNDHNISCKIAGFGNMELKSEFVKKL